MTTCASPSPLLVKAFNAEPSVEKHDQCVVHHTRVDDSSWERIKDVIAETYPEHAHAIQRELLSLKRRDENDQHARIFTARCDGNVAGITLLATTFASHELLQSSWTLVREAYRNRGIAKALLSAAFNFADNVGVEGVYGVTDNPDVFRAWGINTVQFAENRWLGIRKKGAGATQ